MGGNEPRTLGGKRTEEGFLAEEGKSVGEGGRRHALMNRRRKKEESTRSCERMPAEGTLETGAERVKSDACKGQSERREKTRKRHLDSASAKQKTKTVSKRETKSVSRRARGGRSRYLRPEGLGRRKIASKNGQWSLGGNEGWG